MRVVLSMKKAGEDIFLHSTAYRLNILSVIVESLILPVCLGIFVTIDRMYDIDLSNHRVFIFLIALLYSYLLK